MFRKRSAGNQTNVAASAETDQPKAGVLGPGDLLAGRYRILDVTEQTEERICYSAEDLMRCGNCGQEASEPADWCEECGTRWGIYAGCEITQWTDLSAVPPETETFEDDGRVYSVCVAPPVLPAPSAPVLPEEVAAQPCPAEGFRVRRMEVGQASDPGRVRQRDEDSILSLVLNGAFDRVPNRTAGLFVVADGMGGIEAGEVASRLLIEAIASAALRDIFEPLSAGRGASDEELLSCLCRAVQDGHSRVLEESRRRGVDMGSTVTMALVADDKAYVANVGDSRTYLWRQAGFVPITTDHSLVAQLVAQQKILPEDIYTHPNRNIITRSVGDRTCALLDIDTFVVPLQPDDRLVLCCDGLWEMVRDPAIGDIVGRMGAQDACTELVSAANSNGGEDNISAIVVAVG